MRRYKYQINNETFAIVAKSTRDAETKLTQPAKLLSVDRLQNIVITTDLEYYYKLKLRLL